MQWGWDRCGSFRGRKTCGTFLKVGLDQLFVQKHTHEGAWVWKSDKHMHEVCSICVVCAIAVVLPEMGWKRSRHSSQIEHHGQIGRPGSSSNSSSISTSYQHQQQQRETRVYTFTCTYLLSRIIRRVVKSGCQRGYPRAMPVVAVRISPRFLSVNVRDTVSFTWGTSRRLCLCDDHVVEQNRSQSDSRMLLGDAPKGTTRHWPTGWTRTCKWVIYGFQLTPSPERPHRFATPFLNEMCNRCSCVPGLNLWF